MTLIEVLIAIFILAIGLVGILALFPVAVDGVGTVLKRSHGADLAENASVALAMGGVKLYASGATNDWRPVDAAGHTVKFADDTLPAAPVSGWKDWPEAISKINAAAAGDTTKTYEPAARRYFQIPRDLVVDAGDGDAARRTFLDRTGDLVSPASVAGETALSDGYGWSATLMPIDATIDASTRYRVQIAIWRRHELTYYGPTAGFNVKFAKDKNDGDDQSVATLQSVPDGFTDRVVVGDYIRRRDIGVWHKITAVLEDAGKVEIRVTPDLSPDTPTGQPKEFEIASRRWLVGLYETMIDPSVKY
jgi:Tfp pilus assembly protein PilV